MRGVTLLYAFSYASGIVISTHTPHARRDSTADTLLHSNLTFQLTRLMRGVTCGAIIAL